MVVVEFQVRHGTKFTEKDKFLVRFGDAEDSFDLYDYHGGSYPKFEVVFANPNQPVRIGETRKIVVHSDFKLHENATLNVVLHDARKQYEFKRVGVNLDLYRSRGIIAELDIYIPPVYDCGGLYLSVYGMCQITYTAFSQKQTTTKCVLSGVMKLRQSNVHGPIELAKSDTLENTTDLTTQLTFEITGNRKHVEYILGNLITYSPSPYHNQLWYYNNFKIISNAKYKLDTHKPFLPQDDVYEREV